LSFDAAFVQPYLYPQTLTLQQILPYFKELMLNSKIGWLTTVFVRLD
jgi:hypothetical protein